MEKVIASVIAGIFQALAVTYVVSNQEKNIQFKNKLIFFFYCIFISAFSTLFIPNQIRLIYSLTLFSIGIYFILNIKDKRSIIFSLTTMIFLSVAEIIASLLLAMVGIDTVKIVKDVLYNVLANTLISLTSIILIIIPFVKRFILKINDFFIKNKRVIYYLYLFIFVLYMLTLKNGFEFLLKSNYYINILLVIGVTLLIILIIVNEQKQLRLKEVNKMAMNYIQKYEKIITDQGKANHEFKNQLMVIKGYADMNSPKLKDYLDSIVKDANKGTSTYLISQLNKFPDGGVKGLLYYKLSIMEEKGIKYEIYSNEEVKPIAKKISGDQMSSLTKILGVLIDNAIEAASKAKDKCVEIELSKYEKNSLLFNISNTYKGKINQEKIGTGYTTKGKGHGYGLRLVDDILKINQNITYKSKLKDKFYNVNLIVNPNKKKK